MEFVAPAGYGFTHAGPGRRRATDSDANPATGRSAPVTLTPGESNPTVDAGLVYDSTSATCRIRAYPTLLASNGARHVIVSGVQLGAAIDAEGNGQPNATATGDDTAGTPDDEDGVHVPDAADAGHARPTSR